jgi:hypothetical protein
MRPLGQPRCAMLTRGDRDADPATLGPRPLGDRNRLHWVGDVTYQDDKSLVRTGNAPRVMASLRSLAVAVRSPLRGPAALKTGTPGSAAVVEGHLVAVGVGERESAAERPVDGR